MGLGILRKNSMKNLFIIIFLSVFVGCNNSQKEDAKLVKGKAIVEGKVVNFENSSKILSFSGNNFLDDIVQNAIIDSLGNFRAEIELLNSQDVALNYENGLAILYLRPNDSLFLDIDANLFKQDAYPNFEVSGSNHSTTENIRDFRQFHSNYDYGPKLGDSVTVEEYLSDLKKQNSVRDSVLNEFSKQHNPNEEFMHWAKKNNKYSIAGRLLGYYEYFDVNHNQCKPEIFDTNLFPVDDDSAFVSSNYLVHLKDYLMTKYYRDPALAKFAERKDVFGATAYLFDNLIKNETSGLSRDIMLYNFFLGLLENSFAGRDSLWERYEPHLNNKLLVNILREKKLISANRKKTNETTLDLMTKSKSEIVQKFWKTFSTKYKDKIIYIDIWATWCGPCRSEIPYAIDLQNYFKGKPVAFVNLCLASKKDDWKKFIAQNHIEGDNYFFNRDETALLRGELKFHGYPTYMIIDKEGKLADKNAPRPSTGKTIIDLLDKLIEE